MKEIFGKRLKELREQEEMSQAKLGKALKVEQQQIARWESGKITPNGETIASLAIILRTTSDYLLGLTDSEYSFEYGGNGTRLRHKDKSKR